MSAVLKDAVAIRVAGAADLPAVLGLYLRAGLDTEVLPAADAQAVFAQFARYPNYRLFVACEGDAVVGCFALLVMHNLAHCGAPSAIVEDVAVAPDRQGRGIGRAMMVRALAEARAAGCYKLALSSNARRADAHAFYLSLGFAQHGLSFVVDLAEPGAES